MSTIQVEEEVKRQLFAIAAELQSKKGRKTTLNDAIKYLINLYRSEKRDVKKMLSLFGCLGAEPKARTLLKELRAEEEERLGKLERKYSS